MGEFKNNASEKEISRKDINLVSIVIPVYNASQWLFETLTSVLQQNYSHNNLEVILIDDGSTDHSFDLALQWFQHHHLQYTLLRTDNKGPSHARNLGWRKARGTWIQFLDADDLIHPQKIAHQINEAVSLADDVAVIYSEWQRFWNKGKVTDINEPVAAPAISSDDAVADLLNTKNFLQLGSLLIRRNWLDKVGGFDERYWLIEDVHILLRLAMAGGKFYHVGSNQPLFFYRQRVGESLSYRNQQEFIEGCVRNAQLAETYWSQQGILTPQRAAVICEVYFQAARYFAAVDQTVFEQYVQMLNRLIPGFVPVTPSHLRLTSQLLGYRRAEELAVQWRKIKDRAQKLLRYSHRSLP